MRPRPWSRLVVLALALLVGCDHATKLGAEHALRDGGPRPVMTGIDLAYHQNHGVAFNLERVLPASGRTAVILVAGLAALGFLGAALWRRRGATSLAVAGYVLVLAGALGNLIDRLARGYVVDFIHVHRWPVWNVADAWVVLGVAALLVASLRERPPAAPTAPA
ncbi:MAG: signal peptidase II [Myxococcales bacterium]|nr:signal peptidase II [Myxococcales bacterium]